MWTQPPGYVPPAMGDAPTQQELLEHYAFDYDEVGNVVRADDLRVESEWPAGFGPVSRSFEYDDLYRLTRTSYEQAGASHWKSPLGSGRDELPVLFVDDDPAVLTAFQYAVGDSVELLTARSGAEALGVLRERDVAVLMTDQRMPEMTGVELCARARALRPDAIRILVTAYADVQAAIDAINEGQVSRWVNKPWRDADMLEVVRTAVELAGARRRTQALQARLLGSGPAELAAALHEQLAHEIANPVSLLHELLDDVRGLQERVRSLTRSRLHRSRPERAPASRV